MISYFDKGVKAASLSLPASLCRLEGNDRVEWMRGYNFAKQHPIKTTIVDVDAINEAFAEKHFKTQSDES